LLFFVKSRTIELREWNTKHKKETIFPITGTVIRRKLGKAFEAVGGKVGTKLPLSRHQAEILHKCLEEQSIQTS